MRVKSIRVSANGTTEVQTDQNHDNRDVIAAFVGREGATRVMFIGDGAGGRSGMGLDNGNGAGWRVTGRNFHPLPDEAKADDVFLLSAAREALAAFLKGRRVVIQNADGSQALFLQWADGNMDVYAQGRDFATSS